MKKKIVIGSIFAVCILMLLPSVSAVEFNTAVESNKAQILDQMRSMNIDEFRETIKNLEIPYLLAIILSQILFILFVGPIRFLLINILDQIYLNNWSPS